MAGVVPEEDRAAARETFLANLRAILPSAGAAGVTLLLEPINRKDRPGYFYDRIDEAISLMDALDDPALTVMFDCYHVGTTEGDVIARLAAVMPRIGHIQIAAVPNRADPMRARWIIARFLLRSTASVIAGGSARNTSRVVKPTPASAG